MSYRTHHLGAFQGGDSFPSGTLVVGGFEVVGLPSSSASQAVTRLRDAITSSFPSGRVAAPATSGSNAGRPTVGWGPAFGVASGKLYAVISTTADGVTGGQINSMLVATARDLGTRLGLQVRLINAHTTGGAAPLPALTPDLDPSGQIVQGTSPLLVGGIVVGGLVLVAVGIAAFASMRRPVARNRRGRRSIRRNPKKLVHPERQPLVPSDWKWSDFVHKTFGRSYDFLRSYDWDSRTGELMYEFQVNSPYGNDPVTRSRRLGRFRSPDAAKRAIDKHLASLDKKRISALVKRYGSLAAADDEYTRRIAKRDAENVEWRRKMLQRHGPMPRRVQKNGIVWKDSPFTSGRLYSRSGFEWDPSTGALYRLYEGGRHGNDPTGTWKKIGTHRSADAAANAALKFIARRDAAYDKTVARRRSSRRP